MASVSFYQCTLKQYAKLTSTNPSALYFIVDAGKIYRGDVDMTQNMTIVTAWPTANIIPNRFYLNSTTGEIRTYCNDTWYTIVPSITSNAADFDDATKESYLANIKAIKEFVENKIVATVLATTEFVRTISYSDGSLYVNNGTATPVKVELTGVAHDPTFDETALKLNIPVYGKSDLTITIPKGSEITSGRYEASYTLPDGTTGPAIVLTQSDGLASSEVVIPAANLIDTYTGTTTKSATVTVNSNNQISASVNISAAANNGIIEKDDGIFVDLSNLAEKAAATKSVILVADGNGGFAPAEGNVSIKTTGKLSDYDNTAVVTADIVAQAITAAVSGIQLDITGRLDALETKTADAVDGNEIIIGDDNKYLGSGIIIGGATLAAIPSDKVVATEAAVSKLQSQWSTF